MSIKPFKVTPTNEREWARFFQDTEVIPTDGSVGPDQLADHSVTLIKLEVAGSTGQLLIRRGADMAYDTLDDGDIPLSIARTSAVVAVATGASDALAAHVAAPDPHPVYTTAAELATALADYYTKTSADARYLLSANVLSGSKTYDPPDLATDALDITTVTVTGAAAGDFALASHADVSTSNADKVELVAKVTAADTVSVYIRNNHTTNVNLASGTLKVRVWKQ
jgi:hypothetical protein